MLLGAVDIVTTLSPQVRQLLRQIPSVLAHDVARTDAELAAIMHVSVGEVRTAVAILYRQRRVDRCWRWVVLAPVAADEATAA